MTPGRRKLVVTMSAFALGSGIWSMHFVAMLGMRLPLEFYYDALITLISALAAILLMGVALLLVHFGTRTPGRITAAGAFAAVGILTMHYVGMSGIRIVQPAYSAGGLAAAFLAAFALCIGSFWISYGARTGRNILLGTIAFGVTVFAVHFAAMAGTHFKPVDGAEAGGFRLSNETLAIGVALTSFVISGAFLLVGVTFQPGPDAPAAPAPAPMATSVEGGAAPVPADPVKIPFEQNGRIQFVPDGEVAAVRAEGHYTFIYHRNGRLFCPWSITKTEQRLSGTRFLRCHRSYLVNPAFVTGFERKKDKGVCFFSEEMPLDAAPVSRSHLKDVRAALGV